MFRKLKDRISVVGEDIKNDPRFQNGLASVNKVASDTLAAINKSESSLSLQDQVSTRKAAYPFTVTISEKCHLQGGPSARGLGYIDISSVSR